MTVSTHTKVLFAIGLTLTAIGWAGAQTHSVPTSSLTMGRFQIVNPTPDAIINTMLIDTATGQSWQTCKNGERSGWCPLFWHKTQEDLGRALRER
jgi:hypothetical protein